MWIDKGVMERTREELQSSFPRCYHLASWVGGGAARPILDGGLRPRWERPPCPSHPTPAGLPGEAPTSLSRLRCTYSLPALLVPSRVLLAHSLVPGLVPTARALAQLQDGGQVALLGGALAQAEQEGLGQ